MNKSLLTACLCLLSLSACDLTQPSSFADVYRYDNSLQCQPFDKPASLAAMRMELIKAGIDVVEANCGNDGMMRIALCDSPTGDLNIYRIHAQNLQDALALGFGDLRELENAVVVDCPQN